MENPSGLKFCKYYTKISIEKSCLEQFPFSATLKAIKKS
jgi:hypothetical protein